VTTAGTSDFSLTDELTRKIQENPGDAVRFAAGLLRAKDRTDRDRAVAASALARGLLDMGEQTRAASIASQAVSLSVDCGDDVVAFRVRLGAAVVLAESGHVNEALKALDDETGPMSDTDRGRLAIQRAYVLHHAGRLGEALHSLAAAEALLGPDCAVDDRIRLIQNRALVLLQQADFPAAEADLLEAERLGEEAGYHSASALSASNLGVLYGRVRRIAESTRCFDDAIARFERAGNPVRMLAIMHLDRAETLMHMGLVADAVDAAATAVRYVTPTGNRVLLGDAHLLHARTLLAARMFTRAQRAAVLAGDVLRETGRDRMVTHAEVVGALAILENTPSAAYLDETSESARLVAQCAADGWSSMADLLRVARIRAARRIGATTDVGEDIAYLRLGTFSGQRDLALAGWYAEAVARTSHGDVEIGLDACRSGLALLDDIVAEAASLEQRSAALRLGGDLSSLAIEYAIQLGKAETVLAAAEGTRARALHNEMAQQRKHRPLTADGAFHLRRELGARLAGSVLVEWVISGDEVWAVVFYDGRSRLVAVCSLPEVLRARDRVLVWLDRAVEEPNSSSDGAIRAIAALDQLLLTPLGLPPVASLVLVPVGGLHGIPWSGLPSLAGRSVTLSPNAQLWLQADRRAEDVARTVGLIVGPDVTTAGIEWAAVESLYSGVQVGAASTAVADTVRSMFARLDLVHVAAHGTFRSDHPLLSTLRLRDGETTLYDTVPARVQARLVVLSSCEGGAHGAADGSEVLGLAAVMLARGAGAVLAPLTVVRELECADFVADVHACLATGQPFGDAVASARQHWLGDDDLSRWAVASSFTCFGSGRVAVAA
jgi:tetratricopeptide (TPR) repeat protein